MHNSLQNVYNNILIQNVYNNIIQNVYNNILITYLKYFPYYIDPEYVIEQLSPNTPNEEYNIIFSQAVTSGHTTFVRYLIKNKLDNIDDQTYDYMFQKVSTTWHPDTIFFFLFKSSPYDNELTKDFLQYGINKISDSSYNMMFKDHADEYDTDFLMYDIDLNVSKIDNTTYSQVFKTISQSQSNLLDFAQYLIEIAPQKIDSQTYNSVFQSTTLSNKFSDEKYKKIPHTLILCDKNHDIITPDTATSVSQYLLQQHPLKYDTLNLIVNHYTLNSLNTINAMPGIYKVAREGKVNMLKKMAYSLDIDQMIIDPKKNFFTTTIDECFNKRINFYDIKLNSDNKVTAVAQNFCSVKLMLQNGDILTIKGHEAPEVIDYLKNEHLLVDSYHNVSPQNIFTIYLNPGHGFFSFSSKNQNEKIESFYAQGMGSTSDDVIPNDYSFEILFYSTLAAITYSITSIIPFLFHKDIQSANTAINFIKPILTVAAPLLVMHYYHNDIVSTSLDHKIGHIIDEFKATVETSKQKNHLKIKIYLTDEQFENAQKYIEDVKEDCKTKEFNKCVYQFLGFNGGQNCIGFVENLFSHTMNETTHNTMLQLFSNEQLSQYELDNWKNAYNSKGLIYTLIKSNYYFIKNSFLNSSSYIKDHISNSIEDLSNILHHNTHPAEDFA